MSERSEEIYKNKQIPRLAVLARNDIQYSFFKAISDFNFAAGAKEIEEFGQDFPVHNCLCGEGVEVELWAI